MTQEIALVLFVGTGEFNSYLGKEQNGFLFCDYSIWLQSVLWQMKLSLPLMFIPPGPMVLYAIRAVNKQDCSIDKLFAISNLINKTQFFLLNELFMNIKLWSTNFYSEKISFSNNSKITYIYYVCNACMSIYIYICHKSIHVHDIVVT